jgi:D-beta-D-heptose 7-phosphate kinase/D-beta-D-heptose 1-phosphate adenosyltransferase
MMLAEVVRAMAGKRVTVLGDGIIDEYVHGTSSRLSPEAPVPVFVETHREERGGGAENVAVQLETLGCKVLRVMPEKSLWSRKTRYVVDGHQLLRVDADKIALRESYNDLSLTDAFVVSDYAKGWVSPQRCRALINQARHLQIPVVVDPKGRDWTKYEGCSVICPNDLEAKEIPAHLFRTILYKRGPKGLWLDDGSTGHCKESTMIPAHNARKVFDVTGAGDTVVAVIGAALAAGASMVQAALLANVAAGYVVGEQGTASCPVSWLLHYAEQDDLVNGQCVDNDLLACYTAP